MSRNSFWYWALEAQRVEILGAAPSEVWHTMARQFLRSREYESRHQSLDAYIQDLYLTFLDRDASGPEVQFWRDYLARAPQMPSTALIPMFAFSEEFAGVLRGGGPAVPSRPEVDLVMDFYRAVLKRLPDNEGFAYWTQRLRAAQCAGGDAVNSEVDQMSRLFFESLEYINGMPIVHEYLRVADHYDAFLRRSPDPEGFNYWYAALIAQRVSRDEMRRAFQSSPEFQARVQGVISAGCAK